MLNSKQEWVLNTEKKWQRLGTAITVDGSYTLSLRSYAVDLGESVWITPVACGKCR
ncbi:hypothetical protein MESS2_660013 [Mesorhizobium metallidurans STM 2683]|uniref:Uncharacterized protein n=1 Tax=Mesorhizobium metallidurans STM 2683 TaxID=1297569 RepID=M5ESS0_9HYPH|nr:hypothetical protein MESS2_660013 [Mesorhizobium metallidurans STM 2683]